MSEPETHNLSAEYESYEGHVAVPDWTVMVYLAGDNNLSANSIAILQDLEAINHDDNIRVLAGYDPNTPLSKGARYLEIHRHYHHGGARMKWPLHNDMVAPRPMVVSPDFCNENPATIQPVYEPTAREGLSRFLDWALKYPSKRRILILFGHGTLIAGNTFLADTNPPSFLNLKDFARIMRRYFGKQPLDILACDNCVMNGIEAGYELRNYVDYMIGSQSLMLAMGWPFRKIIEAVQRHPKDSSRRISRRILTVCARNLIDFSLMERSTEQAVIDLTKFRRVGLRNTIRKLADALKAGLAYDHETGRILYPEIVDAVRLARLDAQSFWDETFVDLYDFCFQLMRRCNRFGPSELAFIADYNLNLLKNTTVGDGNDQADKERKVILGETVRGKLLGEIADACHEVLILFRGRWPDPAWRRGLVPFAYYVCPQLQYSHGLSIYFPWVLPEDPITFEPVVDYEYQHVIRDYHLKTSFDHYKEYSFANSAGTDWAGFLVQFFKATLRNVRLVDYDYTTRWSATTFKQNEDFWFYKEEPSSDERVSPAVNLQKTSSDTGEQDDLPRVRIKNYPRRFYLSPEDCRRKEIHEDAGSSAESNDGSAALRVSYLGWNIRGLVAEVVEYYPPGPDDDEDRQRQSDTD